MKRKLSTNAIIDIAAAIHKIVEDTDGTQVDAGREIDYAVHAMLMLVDAATRLQMPKQRAESFRLIVKAIAEIAESDYINGPGKRGL